MLRRGIAPAQRRLRHIDDLQLGGIGGWDYLALEPSGQDSSSAGASGLMWSRLSGRRSGIIPNTSGVHGIAFAPN